MAFRFVFPVLPGAPFQGYSAQLHEDLSAVQASWEQLLNADGLGYVFQTWEWNHTWQDTIGRSQGVQPRIIEIRDERQQAVLIFPFGIYRQNGLRVLKFLGDVVSDYRAPICSRRFLESMAPAAFAALWRSLERQIKGVDLIQLQRMPATLDGQPNPMTWLPAAVHNENAHAALLPATMAEFQTRLTTRKLADMRRLLRQLAEVGPISISLDHDRSDREQALAAVFAQKSRRWQETGSKDLFAAPGYAEFYRDMDFKPETGARVRICSMAVGDEIVAAHWGASFRGRYYWILPTYADGQWKRYSCGRALMSAAIEASIEQNYAVFDLTVGDEAYKLDWADHTLALYEYRQPRSVAGLAAQSVYRLKNWARQQPLIRRVVVKLRERLKGGSNKDGKATG